MITVRIHQNFLLSLMTAGRITNMLRVREGLPEGCMLAGARSHDGFVYLDFVDGQMGAKTIDVVFDVALPMRVGGRDS